MLKKILNTIGIFVLFLLPIFALSFLTDPALRPLILFVSVLIVAWLAFYLNHLQEERDRLNREVLLQAHELKKAKEALMSRSATSGGTQTYHEQLLDSWLTTEYERAKRYRRPLSLLLAAIDSFAELSRREGLVVAEVIGQEVAQLLKENVRLVDIVIRQDIDRVIAILPETQLSQARIVAERIRYVVEKNAFRIEGKEIKLTVSIGFTSFDPLVHHNKEDLLVAVEKALVQAKTSGPNNVATLVNETE